MNVIVSYKQKDIIDNANIDAIKDLNGLFNVDDLIAKFKNYFFSKMILDVTSVENFTSREVLQKLVDGIGSDRLIILLPQTPPPPNEFKKMLIDLKIYNFSNNIDDVVKFIDYPNTYETVMRSLDDNYYNDENNNGYVDNSIKGNQNDINANSSDSFNSSSSLGDALNSFNIKEDFNENINSVDSEEENNSSNISNEEENDNLYDSQGNNNAMDSYNLAINREVNNSFDIPKTDNIQENNSSLYNMMNFDNNKKPEDDKNYFPNSDELSQNKSNYVFLNVNGLNEVANKKKKIIGFKNITNHAGSTTLIYVILKTLNNILKKDAFAIEIGHDDFKLFMNNHMARVEENEIDEYISSRHEEIILVDLNDCQNINFCDDIIYLIEPSTIMLNRLMIDNAQIFKEMADKKIVLNKSMLSSNDVSILSSEAGVGFMYNLGPINDRLNNDEIVKLIDVLDIK